MTNNGALGERDQYENEDRKTWMLKNVSRMSSGNILGALFRK